MTLKDLSTEVIAICPIYDKLHITFHAITTLTELNIPVIGVTDGEINFKFEHPLFQLIKRPKVGVHKNAFERIKIGIEQNKNWIYLFDSDTIHIPSAQYAIMELMTILKDDEMAGLYITEYHKNNFLNIENGLRRMKSGPGISMFFNKNTACNMLKYEQEFIQKKEKHWDGFISTKIKSYTTQKSYIEHLGNLEGIHARYRKNVMHKNDVAININEEELKQTLKNHGLENFNYRF